MTDPKVIKLKSKVSLSSFSKSLRSSRSYLKAGWQTKHLILDFSTVEFVDVGVLLSLSTLLEDFKRTGGRLDIKPPSGVGLDRFDLKVKSIKLSHRNSVHRFLENFGFFTTIVEAGFPVIDGIPYIPSSRSLNLDKFSTVPRIIPLRWLTITEFQEVKDAWFSRIILQISQAGRYLPANLSQSISHAFFDELLENVEEHAYLDHLKLGENTHIARGLGAGLIHAQGFSSRTHPKYHYDTEAYFKHLKTGSPVVRLLVADSGVGIPSTIEGQFAKDPRAEQFSNISDNVLVQQVHYAISSFGTRHEDEWIRNNPQKAELRGLARLDGFVKGVDGLLYIRTANICTGLFYINGDKQTFAQANLPYIPGTQIELILPIDRHEKSNPNFNVHTRELDFNYHLIPFDPKSEWFTSVKSRLNSFDDSASVVYLLPSTWGLKGSQTSILLERLTRLRKQHQLLCLMLPYCDQRSIQHLVPSTNIERGDCILISTVDGRYLVYGGDDLVTSQCQSILDEEPVPSGAVESRNITWLSWLVENSSNTGFLYSELLRKTKDYLNSNIDFDSCVVLRSLALSFIDIKFIEDHERLTTPLCSFVFSSYFPDEESSIVLFFDENFPIEIVEAVANHLHASVIKIRLNLENVRRNLPDGLKDGADESCVFFTSLIRSEYTVTSCLKFLIRHGYRPSKVYTIYDHRPDGSAIKAYYHEVPVKSLLAINEEPTEQTRVRNDESPPKDKPNATLITTEEFLSQAYESDAVFILGHFRRGGTRHMSLFPPINWIFRKSQQLQNYLVSEVKKWRKRVKGQNIKIYIPEADVDYASTISKELAQQLTDDGICIQSKYLSDLDKPGSAIGDAAIFLDWGSVRSDTVRMALTRISDAGYKSIKLILLTSQMPPEYEDELFRLKSVYGYPYDGKSYSRIDCDVEFSVIADIPFPIYTEDNCKLCRVRDDLYNLSAVEDPYLQGHLKKKLEIFELSKVNDALRDSEKTHTLICYGERLSAKQTLKIVANRVRIIQVDSLAEAQEFLDLLLEVEPRSEEAFSWIRLLAIDPSVVHQFPLDTSTARDKMADICIEVLNNVDKHSIHWAAVAALRSSSKRIFSQRFTTLLLRHYSSKDVTGELLTGLWSQLSRPYHQNSQDLLRIGQVTYESLGSLREMGLAQSAFYDSLQFIKDEAELLITRLEIANEPRAVITTLVTQYCDKLVSHHPATTKSEQVIADLEVLLLDDEDTEAAKQAIKNNWDISRSFLKRDVSPYISQITDILMTLTKDYGISGIQIRWWESILTAFDSNLDRFSKEISDIVRSETTDVVSVQRALDEARHYYLSFFKASVPGKDEYSYFARQLLYCRTNPNKIIESVLNNLSKFHKFKVEITQKNLPNIFSHKSVFQDAFHHVVMNAVSDKHRIVKNKDSTIEVEVSAEVVDSFCVIHVRNNGTEPSDQIGKGLERYSNILARYDASVEGNVRTNGWSFETTFKLMKWE